MDNVFTYDVENNHHTDKRRNRSFKVTGGGSREQSYDNE